VTREAAAAVIEFDIAAPRPVVWEHFTQPGLRPKWRAADEVRETSQTGRRGVGTVNHCMHGPHAVIEEVLDWRRSTTFRVFAGPNSLNHGLAECFKRTARHKSGRAIFDD
jgi:hypothetical protein